jgi:hypothetical protein
VATAVENVLKAGMGRFGFTWANIRPGEDHESNPVLLIDAEYTYSKKPIDVRATVGLISELRDALEQVGASLPACPEPLRREAADGETSVAFFFS